MEITDRHIKLLQSAAQVDQAIRACYVTMAETARMETMCRATRLKCETMLGELIAVKIVLEDRRNEV
jgi:hypothetical protein